MTQEVPGWGAHCREVEVEEDGEVDFGVAVGGAVGDYVEAEIGGTGGACVRSGKHGVLAGGE